MQDNLRCGQEVGDNPVRLTAFTATIRPLDQNTPAPGGAPRLDIAPAIAHHRTALQGDVPLVCRLPQQTRPGLAARAAIAVIMVAGQYLPDRQGMLEPRIDALDPLTTLTATRHIGLIGDHDQQIASVVQQPTGCTYAR